MPSELSRDYIDEVALGNVSGAFIINKFGKNLSVGTTFVPVAVGGIYQTPQVSGATTLRVKAGNTNDTADGSGAREITLEGIDVNGNVLKEAIPTAGTSAGAASSGSFIRLYRAFVSKSGTYATSAAGSHSADIVIENGAGGTTWATITSTGYPRSQSEIGAYTVPAGYKGYLLSSFGFVDASKTTDILFYRRESILDTEAPYEASRQVIEERSEGGEIVINSEAPVGPFHGPCDIGFLAKVSATTAEVLLNFQLLVIKE